MGEDALARFRRAHMGVVFQSFHLIPTMTAIENVATPLELAGDRDAFDRAADELAAVGLGARLDHYPAAALGRRAAAGGAGARRGDAAGDPARRRADRQPRRRHRRGDHRLLFGLRDRHGATLVLVTHDAEIARALRPRGAAARRRRSSAFAEAAE